MTDGILTPEELAAAEATEIAQPEGGAQATEGQQRDEQGRFVAKPAEGEAVVPDGEKPKDGTVPQGALHAEREKRKASDARSQSLEAELSAAREQLAGIAKLREQIAARKPEPLPQAGDGTDHLAQRLAEIEAGQNRISQHLDTQEVNRAELQQLGSIMAQSENVFRQSQTDYDAAIDHIMQARGRELALYGYGPADIAQIISEEAAEVVRSAVQRGLDPAHLGYQIALSRGYRPADAEAGQGAPAAQGGAAATLAAIGQAQAASKSLGSAAGSTPQQLNAEAVLAMSQDEFDRLYSTPEGKRMIDAL